MELQEGTTTLDSYFNEINIPKEQMPEPPPEPIIKPEPPKETAEEINAKKLQADFTSKIITNLINSGLSFSASLYSIKGNPEDFSASQKDLSDIESQIFEMIKDKGWNLPPWLALSLSISFAYLPVLQKAHKMRKEATNEQKEEYQATEEEGEEETPQYKQPEFVKGIMFLRHKGKSYREIVKETGLSYGTVQRVILSNQ